MCEDSPSQPNIDFKSLRAAVDEVRRDLGRVGDVAVELSNMTITQRPDPFRSRYPTFRWRLIPAVYCAFHAVTSIGGLVAYDAFGNASFSGYRYSTIALVFTLLFSCSAFCWFRNYWKSCILFFVAAIALGRNWIYFY